MYKKLKDLSTGQKSTLPAHVTLGKLLLVMPATNAESERVFSAMKQVKTCMHCTTSDNRLNHLMIMHVHKEMLDELNPVDVANEFVKRVAERHRIFEKFVEVDIPTPKPHSAKATQTYV